MRRATPIALVHLFFCAGLSESAEPQSARPSAGAGLDALKEEDLDQFLPLLKQHYVEAEKLTDDEIARATVQGLLHRLGPGARLLAKVPEASQPSAFRSELLNERTAYLRVGSLNSGNVAELDTALQNFSGKASSSIVDLRATPAGSEFEVAAEVCRRFCRKGRVLFTIKRQAPQPEQILTSRDEPAFRGLLVVLVDRDTAGAAEIIAAVLQKEAKALVLGQRTKGEAVEYADFPLAAGQILRLAVAEAVIPDGPSVFPEGVKPDLAVDVPQSTTDALLATAAQNSAASLVSETERPRMNEAALVAGENPELEAFAARARGEAVKPQAQRDVVLQRALDFIATIRIYEQKPGAK